MRVIAGSVGVARAASGGRGVQSPRRPGRVRVLAGAGKGVGRAGVMAGRAESGKRGLKSY